jgi:hypothetical protein
MEQLDGLAVSSIAAAEKKRQVRRSWTPAQKQEIVPESQVAGASLALIAQRHGIRTALIGSWRRQLLRGVKSRARITKFAAVRVNALSGDDVIEIDLGSGCVRIHGIVDGAMLREVLAVVP